MEMFINSRSGGGPMVGVLDGIQVFVAVGVDDNVAMVVAMRVREGFGRFDPTTFAVPNSCEQLVSNIAATDNKKSFFFDFIILPLIWM
jgi:hypothetical protein